MTMTTTSLSFIDGEAGQLIIAGEPVEALAAGGFEAARRRLWGVAGTSAGDLGLARVRAAAALGEVPPFDDGMDALRAGLARLGSAEPDVVCAAVPVVVARWWRARGGLDPVAPDPRRSHAADFLHMLTDSPPGPAAVRALDIYLATTLDHGLNASTFAARVVASTGSDALSAVVAAVGALKGPLHGGAPGPVLDMLDAIATPGAARAWLQDELAAGRRIMGMGHRVYRVRDPRADVLKAAAEDLDGRRGELVHVVEREAEALLAERHPERRLAANVELYTALVLDAVGLDRALFTPTFAVSRVAGWLAHVAEQRATGRLIRPRALYVEPVVSPTRCS